MSDDATDRQVGVALRFIRAWREPTPAERRADLEQFAVTVLDPRAVIRDDHGIVVFDGGPPARPERLYSEPNP